MGKLTTMLIFPAKFLKCFAQTPERNKFLKRISQDLLLDKQITTLILLRKFFAHFRKLFAESRESKSKNLEYYKKVINLFIWTRTGDFWQPCWFFSAQFLKSFAERPKRIKFNKFFKSFSCVKMLIWTQRKQIWKTCQNVPYQTSPKNFGQDPKETQTWVFADSHFLRNNPVGT